jgi:hypothetical protein
MNFERISTWAEVSACGKYSVSASVHMQGKLKRYLFTAWLRAPDSDSSPSILLVDADPELCRNACRNHAAAQNAPSP